MKKITTLRFLDALYSNLRCCSLSKTTILSFLFMAMLFTSFTLTAQNILGTVPVQKPTGGFGIDGDAYANVIIHTAPHEHNNIGDWFYDPTNWPGSGRGLFDGVAVIDPTRTFFLQDDWGNDDGTTFLTSTKIDMNPNDYEWGPANNLLAKDDMQNVGAHFAFDGPNETGNLWCIFAADRQVVNGDAYIDFEFLQKPLTKTGAITGGFISEGTANGRTIGDLLVTLIFTGGGTSAEVEIRVWEAVTKGYEYVLHPNTEFAGAIYLTNNYAETTVPFDVYGTSPGVYAPNQWAEGAVNLTALLDFGNNPCSEIATLFVRTKTSQSPEAELKDFPIGPIQLSLNLIPTASAVATNAKCYGGNGSVDLTITGGTQPYAITWTKVGDPNFTASTQDLLSVPAGTYNWAVKDANDCDPSGSVTVGQPDALDLVLTPTNATCYGEAKSISAAVTGTPLSDLEINIDGGTFAAVTASPVVFNSLTAANHIIVLRRISDNTCLVTKDVTITEPSEVILSLTSLPENCANTATGSIEATFSGGTGVYNVSIDGGGFTEQVSPYTFANLSTGLHTILVKDANGCEDTMEINVDLIPCVNALCTYTQGYYGNVGGMSCADGQKFTTYNLINKALMSYPSNTMTIGLPGHSLWMTNTVADINAIITVLPGGGSSYVLNGDYPIAPVSGLPSSYLKKGNLNNTLLAQTITLGLNLGVDSSLGGFALQEGTFYTAASEGCGSNTPKLRECIYDQYGYFKGVKNEYKNYSIDPKVIAALEAPTVQGLFALANQALGGGSTNGLSLSAIASAVDKINNAFDGCRIFMGYNVPPMVCATSIEVGTSALAKTTIATTASFEAYPIPFRDVLTIRYKFNYTSDVKIEVFNAQGILMLTRTDINGYLDKEISLNLNALPEQIYIVQVTTNRESSVLKVLSSR